MSTPAIPTVSATRDALQQAGFTSGEFHSFPFRATREIQGTKVGVYVRLRGDGAAVVVTHTGLPGVTDRLYLEAETPEALTRNLVHHFGRKRVPVEELAS